MATLSNAEKGHGTLPRRLTSMQVADAVQDPEKHSLRKRPWRPRVTPFPHILRQEVSSRLVFRLRLLAAAAYANIH